MYLGAELSFQDALYFWTSIIDSYFFLKKRIPEYQLEDGAGQSCPIPLHRLAVR
jgi:hypothetical protein